MGTEPLIVGNRALKLVDRETWGRFHFSGSDWGGPMAVLARMDGTRERPDVSLLWHFSHKRWMDLLTGYAHEPAWLAIHYPHPTLRWQAHDTLWKDGGRLSKPMILRYRDRIADRFGLDIADYIDIRKTLVIS